MQKRNNKQFALQGEILAKNILLEHSKKEQLKLSSELNIQIK